MGKRMTRKDEAIMRSRTLAERIKQRTDLRHRQTIQNYAGELSFDQYEDLAISQGALDYVRDSGIQLRSVFASPVILHDHPELSQYYRGIALLSQKQVQSLACGVSSWENGSYKRKPTMAKCLDVARLYNAVVSSIIEGTSNWTLENGYRNILATIGITLDGFMRNKIGRDAELLIKARIAEWLIKNELTRNSSDSVSFELPENTVMRFSAEPDIEISRDGKVIATIEIKGGKDPSGALERLGAMQKSFEETPPGCENFLIAGVITPEMRSRLDNLGNIKVYLLDELIGDGEAWDSFITEVFHYAVRIV